MNLADMLLDKENERRERVKALLVKAYKKAKLDYEGNTVWIPKHRTQTKEIPTLKEGDTILMLEGKIVDKEWYNRVVVGYLSMYAQKLIEKGDIAVY